MQRRNFVKATAVTAGGLLAGCLGDAVGGGEEFPSDDMTLLTGHGAGGGFDQEIRILAPYVADKYDIDVQVENMTGAGGQVMHEHMWNEAEPDGYTLAQMNGQNVSTQQVLSDVPFDSDEWTYFGQKSHSVRSIIVRSDAVDGFEDFVEKTANGELLWVTTDPAGGGTLIGAYFGALSGLWEVDDILDNMVVTDGTGDAVPLMGSGDADVLAVSHGTAERFANENDFIDLLMVCTTGDPPEGSEDVPTLATEDVEEGKAIEDAISQRRIIIGPPGMEEEYPDRVELLQDGFEEILTSDEFVNELTEAGRSPSYLPPDEAKAAVAAIRDTHREMGILER